MPCSLLKVIGLLTLASLCHAQTLTPLKNQLEDGIDFTLQLTDGSVMVHALSDSSKWWRLSPDATGSFVNGTWTPLASLPYAPYAFASQVLADGRVLVVGGEYSGPTQAFTLTNQSAIYDPVRDTWTSIASPPGMPYIGDSATVVLTDGSVLLGNKLTKQMASFDPKTNRWTSIHTEGKSDRFAEEGFTLLQNGSVLALDVTNAPHAEIYDPEEREWRSAGYTSSNLVSPPDYVGCLNYGPGGSLCYLPAGEIGPALVRPDGTVFATGSFQNGGPEFTPGSAGHTAIYDPRTRTWTSGPDFPNDDNAGDSWAILLPNGHPLVAGIGWVYEFDGMNLIENEPLAPFYAGALALLPSGEVLAGGDSLNGWPAQIYVPTGSPDPAWRPVILGIQESDLHRGATYKIWGTQFNGLSQGAAYGDEEQSAQNFPLVRITNDRSHHVAYARTHDHSTMGIATGAKRVWTYFEVPPGVESGPSHLVVVANAIASEAVAVSIR